MTKKERLKLYSFYKALTALKKLKARSKTQGGKTVLKSISSI